MAKEVISSKDWRSWVVGDNIKWHSENHSLHSPIVESFDYEGKVSQVYEDHVLVRVNYMTLYVDDDNIELFERI